MGPISMRSYYLSAMKNILNFVKIATLKYNECINKSQELNEIILEFPASVMYEHYCRGDDYYPAAQQTPSIRYLPPDNITGDRRKDDICIVVYRHFRSFGKSIRQRQPELPSRGKNSRQKKVNKLNTRRYFVIQQH